MCSNAPKASTASAVAQQPMETMVSANVMRFELPKRTGGRESEFKPSARRVSASCRAADSRHGGCPTKPPRTTCRRQTGETACQRIRPPGGTRKALAKIVQRQQPALCIPAVHTFRLAAMFGLCLTAPIRALTGTPRRQSPSNRKTVCALGKLDRFAQH